MEELASVPDALTELGGVARRKELVRRCGRAAVDAALADSALIVVGRHYALPGLDEAQQAATRLSGVISHRTAAISWGWGVRTVPLLPDITLPRNRKVATPPTGVLLHRADLGPDDVDGRRTSRERTLLDCVRTLPFAEALAVADSALREGTRAAALTAAARDARGPGSAQARRVASAASGLAANPFESALRACCLDVPGLAVEPQVKIRDPHWLGRPDLVDRRLKMVLEADSFEWHGGREALHRDANRYNAFVVAGWLVLRFSWEEVLLHSDRVTATLEAAVRERTEQACPSCRAA